MGLEQSNNEIDPSGEAMSAWMDAEEANLPLKDLMADLHATPALLSKFDDWQLIRESLQSRDGELWQSGSLLSRVRSQLAAEMAQGRAERLGESIESKPDRRPASFGLSWLNRFGPYAAVVSAVAFVGLVAWNSFERPEAWMTANVVGLPTSASDQGPAIDPDRLREYLDAHRGVSAQGAGSFQAAAYSGSVAEVPTARVIEALPWR